MVKCIVLVVGVCGDLLEGDCGMMFVGYLLWVGFVFFVEVDECYV